MTEFENIVIGKSSVPSLTVTVIAMIAIPLVFFLCWRGKHKGRINIGWLIAGAVGFLVSARVLECGRHIIIKCIMKKNRTRENAVLYGIGHGGIEILAVILPAIITYLAVAVLFSAGDRENALRTLNITEETAAAALPSVLAAASFDYALMAMNVLERLFSMFLHIGLTVIVYYGVINAKRICLPGAIALHMLMDTFPALYQRGVLPLWAVEVWVAVWTVIIVFIAVKLYREIRDPEYTDP